MWRETQRATWFEQQMRYRDIGKGREPSELPDFNGGVFMVMGLDKATVLSQSDVDRGVAWYCFGRLPQFDS